MWRRVSCEQPLNTSQSILSLRGSLDQVSGAFLFHFRENDACQTLGERETGSYSSTW